MDICTIPTPCSNQLIRDVDSRATTNRMKACSPVCFFPACLKRVDSKKRLLQVYMRTRVVGPSVDIATIRLTACAYHSDLMKARRIKKSLKLMQRTSLRYVFGTLDHLMGRTVNVSLSELVKVSKKAKKLRKSN
jgi:hypothetical protein